MSRIYHFARSVVIAHSFLLAVGIGFAQTAPTTPPLPPPTQEQLQMGRALLEKIMLIVKNVPLSKPLEVFQVFGVDAVTVYPQGPQTRTPTALFVQDPKPRELTLVQITTYEKLAGERLKEIGVGSIRIKYPLDKTIASDGMGIDFLPNQACVSIDDVRKLFLPLSKNMLNPKLGGGIVSHPLPTPPPVHDFLLIVFELHSMHPNFKTNVNFSFDYQTCAASAGISNILNLFKETPQ